MRPGGAERDRVPAERRTRPARPRPASRTRIRLAALGTGVIAVVALGATVGYHELRDSSLFDVHDVVVSGADRQVTGQVDQSVQTSIGGRSLLALDRGAIVRALEQLPTVREARIDRDFPSTLRVTVVPERAVAIAVSGHDRALVSGDGRVILTIGRRSAPPGGYPRVGIDKHGIPAAGGHLRDRAVLDELAALPAKIGSSVAWVRSDPRRGPFLELRWPHLPIYLGDTAQMTRKLTAARDLLLKYPTIADRRALEYIDVSNPEAPSVMTETPNPTTFALGQTATTSTDPASSDSTPSATTPGDSSSTDSTATSTTPDSTSTSG
jgi:cell division protein FtsQ